MFKVESYITPIILSYVDKYIKNFRPEDSQVITSIFTQCERHIGGLVTQMLC